MIKLKKELVIDVIVLLLILLWVYAATAKIIDGQKFREQLGQSPMLAPYVNVMIILIPALEYLLSFLMLFDRFRIYALYGSFSLMVIFTTYIIAITRFSDFVPCSCGGVLEKMSWNQHLDFNVVFVVLILTGVFLYQKKKV